MDWHQLFLDTLKTLGKPRLMLDAAFAWAACALANAVASRCGHGFTAAIVDAGAIAVTFVFAGIHEWHYWGEIAGSLLSAEIVYVGEMVDDGIAARAVTEADRPIVAGLIQRKVVAMDGDLAVLTDGGRRITDRFGGTLSKMAVEERRHRHRNLLSRIDKLLDKKPAANDTNGQVAPAEAVAKVGLF
jgi:hypothetical protein